ncbi:Predicted Fe2+/Mn2+ transporter, VIT1/CCC1 family [Kibdelosporangium aridum]|uniref:Predicted Fe2+/Mn2+ transporter, VIT1/CCC1 family n=1 Tax=Kibdelosporangium aridum TaxID=2030 RepID=A0A1Y5X0W2_KIBAR|nr:Predicted Fe2+/Mn2+ transporter, VIT1/CCC1 family [Kibdelosporangium aridum]
MLTYPQSVTTELHHEPHEDTGARLNWLRAGVLGANDGVVSTASLVLGVAGATTSVPQILTAGFAGMFAGAMSMAAGEYVSVSSQRDAEKALLDQERRELTEMPQHELDELTEIYREKGLSPELAREVAEQLTEKDALAAHAEAELKIDPDELTSPWQAAFASFVAFTVGSLLPLLAFIIPAGDFRISLTVLVAVLALALTGSLSARLGGAPRLPAIARNVAGGIVAMAATYGIGHLVGAAI